MTPHVALAGPRWLTPAEAASYLGLANTKAIYRLVQQGLLRPHRLGRRLRFKIADLDAALEPPSDDERAPQ